MPSFLKKRRFGNHFETWIRHANAVSHATSRKLSISDILDYFRDHLSRKLLMRPEQLINEKQSRCREKPSLHSGRTRRKERATHSVPYLKSKSDFEVPYLQNWASALSLHVIWELLHSLLIPRLAFRSSNYQGEGIKLSSLADEDLQVSGRPCVENPGTSPGTTGEPWCPCIHRKCPIRWALHWRACWIHLGNYVYE